MPQQLVLMMALKVRQHCSTRFHLLPAVTDCVRAGDATSGRRVTVVGGEHALKTGDLTSPSPVEGLDADATYEVELDGSHEHVQVQGRDLSPSE